MGMTIVPSWICHLISACAADISSASATTVSGGSAEHTHPTCGIELPSLSVTEGAAMTQNLPGQGRPVGSPGGGAQPAPSAASRAKDAVGTAATGVTLRAIPNETINPVFEATVDATSEAILNAMLAAETMTGADGRRVHALPHDRLLDVLRKYGRVR